MNNNVYLYEAFKELKTLNEEDFNLSDPEAFDKLNDFKDTSDDEEDVVDIIDPEAETEDDLQDSYIGKVILDCTVCHSKIYKDKEDIKLTEEKNDEILANDGEECPFCLSRDGYKIIGEVCPFKGLKDQDEPDVKITKSDDKDEESEEDDELEESYRLYESEENHEFEKTVNGTDIYHCTKCDKYVAKINGEKVKADTIDEIEDKINNSKVDEGLEDGDDFTPEQMRDFKDPDYFLKLANKKCKNCESEDTVEEGFWNRKEDKKDKKSKDARKDAPRTSGSRTPSNMSDIRRRLEMGEALHVEAADEDNVVVDKNPDGSININVGSVVAGGPEVIGEVSPETATEIAMNSMGPEAGMEEAPVEGEELPMDAEMAPEEMPMEGEEMPADDTVEQDVQDFDEESFDGLGESYLKNVYDNVNSFKTTSVSEKGNQIVVEGLIKFDSGNEKRTSFVFTPDTATLDGKVSFTGLNEQISRGKKSFTLTGQILNNKLISESLKYNYRAKKTDGTSQRVYGKVRV